MTKAARDKNGEEENKNKMGESRNILEGLSRPYKWGKERDLNS